MAPESESTLRARLERLPSISFVLIGLAYLSALASIISYMVIGDGGGTPTRLEILLIAAPVFILYFTLMTLQPSGE